MPPPPSRSGTLLIPEGWRASQVYDAVDKALELPPGTTRVEAAPPGSTCRRRPGQPRGLPLPGDLPDRRHDHAAEPAAVHGHHGGERFGTPEVTQGSQRTATGLYETITVASIVQAEADTEDDMGKVARVIRNRLARGMPLQMDSTLNYALDRSTLDTSRADTRVKSPYNTYAAAGLPPTPIGNPGEQAVRAALAPPPGDWLYFVTVKPGDTRFTADYGEHLANVEEFNRYRSTTAS